MSLRALVVRLRPWRRAPAAAVGSLVAIAGCSGAVVDVAQSLRVTEVTTGWFDAGLNEQGQNKLVPTISFRLENVSDTDLGSLQVNGLFRRLGEDSDWGSAFVRVAGRDGLPAGQLTEPIVLRSTLGYTGEQPRLEMFEHKEFVDVKVELFVKHRAEQWVKLHDVQVDRQLLTE